MCYIFNAVVACLQQAQVTHGDRSKFLVFNRINCSSLKDESEAIADGPLAVYVRL